MSEMLDTGLHERRRAERMRDPEFRAAYEQAARCGASMFDRSLCFCRSSVGVMHTFVCELLWGHEGAHVGHDDGCEATWTDASCSILARCICSGCNRPSDPRPVGTAPDGWVKLSSLRGSVVYRCPECKEGR